MDPPTHPPESNLGRWMRGDAPEARTDPGLVAPEVPQHTAPWYLTLWLTGVDYFSSLGYAPGLAFLAAGYVAPLATLILVFVTFAAAVPVYAFVAKHSHQGEGSIKMIERLTTGWGRLGWLGKTLVLVLLGFAMTDFVITITLSAADATVHILENPLWPKHLEPSRTVLTAGLILMLCAVFLKGFKEAIGLAAAISIPYMLMNYTIITAGFVHLGNDPTKFDAWWALVSNFDAAHLRSMLNTVDPIHALDPVNWIQGGGFGTLLLVSVLVFPKLALGLSGFETGVAVMPLITGATAEDRIRRTRRLLVIAALLMSIGLLGSSITTALIIPSSAFAPHGEAHGRAISYLAHHLLGHGFGTVYDVFTVLILWFAGSSAMAGLLNIIPRYLPRFGMSPDWLAYRRPMVLVMTGICLLVNYGFDADVEAQGGAYATGVLVLMASGALAVTLAEWQSWKLRVAFTAIMGVFGYVLVVNVIERPDGLRIAGYFIGATVLASLYSRWHRASELRVQAFSFVDRASASLWKELIQMPRLVLVPHRTRGPEARQSTVARTLLHLDQDTRAKTKMIFLHVELTEDPSTFTSPIKVKCWKEGEDVVIEVTNAVAVANAIAYIGLELGVDEVVIGLLDSGTPVVNAVLYLLFGTGEVGYAVRAILNRVRDDRLVALQLARKLFDKRRDQLEIELLKSLIDKSPDERDAAMKKAFDEEEARFRSEVAAPPKLPRLILVA
jgi:hypothetical protein